jgi:hypothetical protein
MEKIDNAEGHNSATPKIRMNPKDVQWIGFYKIINLKKELISPYLNRPLEFLKNGIEKINEKYKKKQKN